MALPVSWWIVLGVLVVLALLIVKLVRRLQLDAAARMLDEFMRAFPDKCPICSFHQHQLFFENRPLPPHECKEGKSPPWPLPQARSRPKWTRLE